MEEENKNNKNEKRMNKKGISISIVLLVIMTLVIIGAVLYIFLTNSDKISSEVKNPNALNELYLRENEIDFYIYNIMEKAASNSDIWDVADFIISFNKELENYKEDERYIIDTLSAVEGQVNEKNVFIKDGKVYMKLGFKISRDSDRLSASYLYDKEFAVDTG